MSFSSLETRFPFIEVEPYWNVNADNSEDLEDEDEIEVEPYWNVNFSASSSFFSGATIEVEPYWNVNVSSYDEAKASMILK